MDWLARPPEVNSALIYSGPGVGPLMSTAAAWGTLSTALEQTATAMSTAWGELMGTWTGPSAAAATMSIHSYITWITMTAGQSGHTASLASAAAAAYEQAYAMTIPPPVVAQNRTQLAALIATNFLGINTPAIMATEAEYTEFWAQDATAMTAYSAQSMAITAALPTHIPAPQTTDPTATARQTAATSSAAGLQAGTTRSTVNAVTTAAPPSSGAISDDSSFMDTLNGYGENLLSSGAWSPVGVAELFTSGHDFMPGQYPDTLSDTPRNIFSEPEAVAAGVAPPQSTWATTGDASKVGGLSVPNSWATQPAAATTQTTPQVSPLTTTPEEGAPGTAGMPGMYGAPGTNRTFGQQPRYGQKLTVIARPFSGG